jgi:hypothetical protein
VETWVRRESRESYRCSRHLTKRPSGGQGSEWRHKLESWRPDDSVESFAQLCGAQEYSAGLSLVAKFDLRRLRFSRQ